MFFKKKKNPNSDFITSANATTPQPTTQPTAPPPSNTQSSSDDELTIGKLLTAVDYIDDPVMKSKAYMLMGDYYYKGTNGAVQDTDKALEYYKLSIDTDKNNVDAAAVYGSLMYIEGVKVNDTDKISTGILNLILAYNKGNKLAASTLNTIAKSDMFKDVNTADELIAYLLKQ